MLLGVPSLFGKDFVPTDLDNARYFLSAMVQAQAAIVTLVISLTLIAIQMASASYTPRVVDVMKKNPDMWYLLIIYVSAISYGFFSLKIVSGLDRFLISSVLILGIYSFIILFLYMKHTIALLRSDSVVQMLVSEINADNIHQEGWKKELDDDIMQPVFDIVHSSINRYDVTTTRTGLNALSERLLEIFATFKNKIREENAKDVAEYFCKHIKRSALIAFKNEDEEILREIIDVLKHFGTGTVNMELEKATSIVAEALEEVGIHSVKIELEIVTEKGIKALRKIGIQSSDKGLIIATNDVIDALEKIGTQAADNKLEKAAGGVASALGEVGIHTVAKGLNCTYGVISALGEVGLHTADKKLTIPTMLVTGNLCEVAVPVFDKKMDQSADFIVENLCKIGCMYEGREPAASCLNNLIVTYKEPVIELILNFKPSSDQKDQFTIFIQTVNEHLRKHEIPYRL